MPRRDGGCVFIAQPMESPRRSLSFASKGNNDARFVNWLSRLESPWYRCCKRAWGVYCRGKEVEGSRCSLSWEEWADLGFLFQFHFLDRPSLASSTATAVRSWQTPTVSVQWGIIWERDCDCPLMTTVILVERKFLLLCSVSAHSIIISRAISMCIRRGVGSPTESINQLLFFISNTCQWFTILFIIFDSLCFTFCMTTEVLPERLLQTGCEWVTWHLGGPDKKSLQDSRVLTARSSKKKLITIFLRFRNQQYLGSFRGKSMTEATVPQSASHKNRRHLIVQCRSHEWDHCPIAGALRMPFGGVVSWRLGNSSVIVAECMPHERHHVSYPCHIHVSQIMWFGTAVERHQYIALPSLKECVSVEHAPLVCDEAYDLRSNLPYGFCQMSMCFSILALSRHPNQLAT
jgi:hypothetical protein